MRKIEYQGMIRTKRFVHANVPDVHPFPRSFDLVAQFLTGTELRLDSKNQCRRMLKERNGSFMFD